MILTVTLNVAIDRTFAVPSFRLGHRHRAVEPTPVAGGKGVNVARALKFLGRPVIATGFAGGPTGARIIELLDGEGITTDFVWIAGESRIDLAVVDPTSGAHTEINERGPDVIAGSSSASASASSTWHTARGSARSRQPASAVPAGSGPPGRGAQALGVQTIVDPEGEPLRSTPAR